MFAIKDYLFRPVGKDDRDFDVIFYSGCIFQTPMTQALVVGEIR